MRLFVVLLICTVFYRVSCKNNNVKQLTESQGQEIIEIGHPIRGLDEEPSADVEENAIFTTKKEPRKSTTKKDVDTIDGLTPEDEEEAKIAKELAEIYRDTSDYKESDDEDEKPAQLKPQTTDQPKPTVSTQEKPKQIIQPKIQDAKTVVKEIKKDIKNVVKDTKQDTKNAIKDIKQDAKNVVKELKLDTKNETKEALRTGKKSFKFQPDTTDRASVDRFRTSIDDLSCNQKLFHEEDNDDDGPDSSASSLQLALPSCLLISFVLYCNQ